MVGVIAQRESTSLTWKGSQVQSLLTSPFLFIKDENLNMLNKKDLPHREQIFFNVKNINWGILIYLIMCYNKLKYSILERSHVYGST